MAKICILLHGCILSLVRLRAPTRPARELAKLPVGVL
jgi:hypothetical protein